MPKAAFSLVEFFQVVSILGSALTAFKLYTSGLFRRYRIFFIYFLFRVPYMIPFLVLPNTSTAYLNLFLVTEPLIMLFYVLVVLEVYGLVLERYKGIYTLGRWVMYLAVAISATISTLSVLQKITPSTPLPSARVFTEFAVERGICTALVIFILLIVWFLSRYPVALSRNVLVHTGIYSVFFLANSLGLIVTNFSGYKVSQNVNLFLMGVSSACAVAWWLGLSAKGEETQVHTLPLRPGTEERILHQLDALNATLLRVAKIR